MTWVIRHGVHYSPGYQIYALLRGFEVWRKDEGTRGKYHCLGREIATLPQAKALCESDAKENTPDSLADTAGALR